MDELEEYEDVEAGDLLAVVVEPIGVGMVFKHFNVNRRFFSILHAKKKIGQRRDFGVWNCIRIIDRINRPFRDRKVFGKHAMGVYDPTS